MNEKMLLFPQLAVFVLAFSYMFFNMLVAFFCSFSARNDMSRKYKSLYGLKVRTPLFFSEQEVELNFHEDTVEYKRAKRLVRFIKRSYRGFFVCIITFFSMFIIVFISSNT